MIDEAIIPIKINVFYEPLAKKSGLVMTSASDSTFPQILSDSSIVNPSRASSINKNGTRRCDSVSVE